MNSIITWFSTFPSLHSFGAHDNFPFFPIVNTKGDRNQNFIVLKLLTTKPFLHILVDVNMRRPFVIAMLIVQFPFHRTTELLLTDITNHDDNLHHYLHTSVVWPVKLDGNETFCFERWYNYCSIIFKITLKVHNL